MTTTMSAIIGPSWAASPWTTPLGLHPLPFQQLAPAHVALPYARLPGVRSGSAGWPPPHQLPPAHSLCDTVVSRAAGHDGESLAPALAWRPWLPLPDPRRMRGLGGREGLAERAVLPADLGGLCAICKDPSGECRERRCRPPSARASSWPWYALLIGLFALGLMAKPMLVTLPFVLLLLDYWPLRRSEPVSGASAPAGRRVLAVDGIPAKNRLKPELPTPRQRTRHVRLPSSGCSGKSGRFLALTVISCAVTCLHKRPRWFPGRDSLWGPVRPTPLFPPPKYVLQFAWPVGLNAFYPLPRERYHPPQRSSRRRCC